MRIAHNISAINSTRILQRANNITDKNLEVLTSNRRINRAADDIAGLAISEKMRNQVSGLKQATRNAQNGISMVQTAEGALNETHAILNRMRNLAIQASNGTLQDEDRAKLDQEFSALQTEIDRIANTSEFNTKKLLDGSMSSGITFNTGANNGEITIALPATDSNTLGIKNSHITNRKNAIGAIDAIDAAVTSISSARGSLGTVQKHLEFCLGNSDEVANNLSEAESRIRDADMAEALAAFSKNQILTQSATAMLSQANSRPQAVLKILG